MKSAFKVMFVLFIFVSNAIEAFANQSSTSSLSVKASDIKPTTFTKDIDTEVSDIKMRADSGAKSKISTSLSLHYAGASLHKPLDDQRPNVGEGRESSPVSASGNIGIRDRRSANESVYIAAGFSRKRPFSTRDDDDDQIEINTPHVTYNNTFGLENTQLSSSVRFYIATLEYQRNIGQVATIGYSLTAMTKSQTRFNAGVTVNTWANAFNKDESYLKRRQNDVGIGLIPSVQYKFSDKSNFYSSWSVWNYSHYRDDDFSKFDREHVTQSVGMGYAVVRDVYLAPNISFFTSNIDSDKTAVNFSATINL